MSKFTAFKNVQSAVSGGCFKCSEPLVASSLKESGYPPKRGQYVMQCGKCRLFTFFDLRVAAK